MPLLRQVVHLDHQRWEVLERARLPRGVLLVVERRDESGLLLRRLMDGVLIQNTYAPETRQSLSVFTGGLTGLARAYTPGIKSALVIGLGAGLVPRQLAGEGAVVDVVEINPAIPGLAEKYFDFKSAAINRLEICDGLDFLKSCEGGYDTIVLDAFQGEGSPRHLTAPDALRWFREKLQPQGTLVINRFGEFSAQRRALTRELHRTLIGEFGVESVRLHASGQGNVFFVATPRASLEPCHLPNFSAEHPTLRFELQLVWEGLRPPLD